MSEQLEQLIRNTDPQTLDWLEANIDLLDSNLTVFCDKLVRELSVYEINPVSRIVCDEDFCGLNFDEAYNIVMHDEKQGTWDALDLYNKEYAAAHSYNGTTRYHLYDIALYGPNNVYKKLATDPDLAFMCFTTPSFANFDKVACINNNQIQRSSFRVKDLRNTNFWVAIRKDQTIDTYPAKWKFDKCKYPMKVYHDFRTVTKVGGVYLAGKQHQMTTSPGANTEIIFVPAKRIASGGSQAATLNTYVPEHIVDKYGLPKAQF